MIVGRDIKKQMQGIRFLLAAILLVRLSSLSAQDLKISAEVNRTEIGLNQQFELTVELTGADAQRAPQPELPDISAFAAFLGTSSSQNIQIVNSQMSVTKSYSHHYVATKVGKFQIPPLTLDYRGNRYTTNLIDIEIVQSSTPSSQGNQPRAETSNDAADLSEVLFLKATANRASVYQNEPVIVTYKIYTAVSVNGYAVSQSPNMVGFWNEEFSIPQRPKLYDEVINGRQYRVAEIKKVALFPQGPGTKTLEPLAVDCEVQLPRRQSRRDIFDSFFDDPFFGVGRTVRQTIRSNPITINVLPLPEGGKPADFSGAVGSFSISATVDKNSVKTNDAIKYKVKLAGSGNIKILPQPKIDFPSDFEVYEPTVTENIQRENNQISGDKTFEYVLIPRFPGNQTIKPVVFSYFELANKSYQSVTTDALEIAVSKGSESFISVPLATSKEDVKFIGQDIRFIQLRMPEFQRMGTVFYKTPLFYSMLTLPLLALAGAFGYRRHLNKLSANEAYARSRKANKMALKRLGDASTQMRKGNPKAFYAEVSKALMGFIGDKLNVSAAGLITDEVEAVLRRRRVPEAVVQEYLDCLKTCDFRRFAPSESDNGQMKILFEKARKALINLDKGI
jgi:hypothetical protein